MPGLVDETGQLRAWIDWTCDGNLSFASLWSFYSTLRSQYSHALADDNAGAEGSDQVPVPEQTSTGIAMPRLVETAFAAAFASSLENRESAGRWSALLEHDIAGAWPALEESFHMVSRFVGRSRGALGKLSASGVLRVLKHSTVHLPTGAVHVDVVSQMPNSQTLNRLTGIYKPVGKERASQAFIRIPDSADTEGQPKLMLRRCSRDDYGSSSFNLNWTGVPVSLLRAARIEWKILPADAFQDDEPLAIALDNADEPSNITAQWWIHFGKKFHQIPGVQVRISKQAFDETESRPFQAAIVTWALKHASEAGSSSSELRELIHLAKDRGEEAKALLQLCEMALKDVLNTPTAELDQCTNCDEDKVVSDQRASSSFHNRKTNDVPAAMSTTKQELPAAVEVSNEAAHKKVNPSAPLQPGIPRGKSETKANKGMTIPSPSRAPLKRGLPPSSSSGDAGEATPAKAKEVDFQNSLQRLPRLEEDLQKLLESFEENDGACISTAGDCSDPEPSSKMRRFSSNSRECESVGADVTMQSDKPIHDPAEEDSQLRTQPDRKTSDIQQHLGSCPGDELASILKHLLATRPEAKALLGNDMAPQSLS
jgi:hypothetical protein